MPVNELAELAAPLLFGLPGTAFRVGMVFVVNSVMRVGGGLVNRRGEVP